MSVLKNNLKMCEVTQVNFNEIYSNIEKHIKNSAFIAIDCEFSGILHKKESKRSLFDTQEERYIKSRQIVENFIPIQIGITTFEFERQKNRYNGHCYAFYIFPRSVGSIDSKFLCQASSFQFLCDYNFDFNKFVYEGLPYLNRQQESKIIDEINSNTLYQFLQSSISHTEDKLLLKLYLEASTFLQSANENEIFTLPFEKIYRYDLIYILQKNIRNILESRVWTEFDNNIIKIQKVTKEKYKFLSGDKSSLENDFLQSMLGFTKVFRLLCQVKKPIVGHNLFLDLLLIYNQFEKSLPNTYTDFKKQIISLFPVIYDTKHISFRMRDIVPKTHIWESNILDQLYYYFENGKGRHVVLNSPLIELLDENLKEDMFHNAGFDSYCTGYCLIRMAHIFASKKYDSLGRELTSAEHMRVLSDFKNCVNVIRGNVSFIRLDGSDPISERPEWLYVETVKSSRIDIAQVTSVFGKHGSVDIKPLSHNSVIIAVSNHKMARDMLKKKRFDDYKITKYSILRHSPISKVIFWSGLILSGGIVSVFVHKYFFSI